MTTTKGLKRWVAKNLLLARCSTAAEEVSSSDASRNFWYRNAPGWSFTPL